mmetsp:Transcript_97062/g.274315  ORF Transcript_97062/g.274315 Transcript_97062/m.274315 type:complete len:907 (-) Transcript_97062:282-3002(-)
MGFGVQWIVDKITFPSPPPSYSLTSHPELFFVKGAKDRPTHPGVPCMLYAIPQGAPVLLVHAHSNGCDIGDMRQTLQSISESLRIHVMSFEYPGYGLNAGSASKRSIDDAASTVLHFLIDELRINPAQIVWYGRSIGSGAATCIAHRMTKELDLRPGGLVLQCGFANFPEVAGHLFGRVAKRLVSTLWPNEAMLKEVRCPVLIMHGRNDTMIPIEQSEKLWRAVHLKEQSRFQPCDCGHNDFNFRQCTLRPLYDFLSGVISGPEYPASNFNIDVSLHNRMFVYHIGPLRPRLNLYNFRRPDLDMWIRQLMPNGGQGVAMTGCGGAVGTHAEARVQGSAKAAATKSLGAPTGGGFRSGQKVVVQGFADRPELNGVQGQLLEFDNEDGQWLVKLDNMNEGLRIKFNNLKLASEANRTTAATATAHEISQRAPTAGAHANIDAADGVAGRQSPASSKNGKKGKKKQPHHPPPIPDFSTLPLVEDISEALFNAAGMVRACTERVCKFLERLQCQLERVEGLEQKPLEELVEFVESEFWTCDPLFSLWEEVQLPMGDRVRLRLGPYSVDNFGERKFETKLGTSLGADVLRIPRWVFCPTAAQFRSLTEWSLLHLKRLEHSLPPASQALQSSGCCCMPCRRLRKCSSGRSSRRGQARQTFASRGTLATAFAAHFVNWVVEKTDEGQRIFATFIDFHQSPETALQKTNLPTDAAIQTVDRPAEKRQGNRLSVCDNECAPWSPSYFSAGSREVFRDGAAPGPSLLEFCGRMWTTPVGSEPPNVNDIQVGSTPTHNQLGQTVSDRNLDWGVAVAFHRCEQLERRNEAGIGSGEGDPLRPEMRQVRAALNKAMRAFGHAKREQERRNRSRPPPPRAITSLDPEPPKPEGAGAKPPGPPPSVPAGDTVQLGAIVPAT